MARDVWRDRDEAVRITTAESSRNADISARQRRYVISMGIRTICFIAAVVVGGGWLRWVLVVAALLLPYVAVVMANAANSKSDGFELVDGHDRRSELTSGGESGTESDEPGPHPL
jgi:Mn2+/Fe2+ NRAMP family transporter